MPAIVNKVLKDSIAEELEIAPQDEIMSIDGVKMLDMIDYNYLCKSELITLEIKKRNGEIEEIYCEYDPESKSGMPGSMRKVKGTLHWVSARHCKDAEVRLYDRLFMVENPDE